MAQRTGFYRSIADSCRKMRTARKLKVAKREGGLASESESDPSPAPVSSVGGGKRLFFVVLGAYQVLSTLSSSNSQLTSL